MPETALALFKKTDRVQPFYKSWESSSPSYSMRALTSFGKEITGSASKDARPEITSKDVISALHNTLTRPPAFSLVSRCYIDETRECTKSPGPQRYTQPGIISNLSHPLYPMPPTKVFVGSSRKMHEVSDTPAPGEYEIIADAYLKKAPAYGFRIKPFETRSSSLAPDSGSYDVVEIGKTGRLKRGPSWSLRGRWHERKSDSDPDDKILHFVQSEPPAILGRRKIDTSGTKRSKPVPNWSFPKSDRFL
jgi:hypothetical protein